MLLKEINKAALEVLLVDDDPVVLFMHKRLLVKSNIHNPAYTVSTGQEAIDFLTNNATGNTEYLVMLDINMPVLDGWGFLDLLQSKPFANKCHVVMVTSSIDNFDKEKAGQYNRVIGFCEKPLTVEHCNDIKLKDSIAHFFLP